ncbi:carboxypeptidase regulatory-like domain-containing protein [Parasegetibacter sp. NRK P23]|uniref:carboxypeptidase regulatory-like domain-containing protein n=1 Tax=Parasegetibacter sp. NRK P23 TaxID=2942999 RepID=UPI00204304EC|nr:carboxypeptidase regulatory-like domain-containing protein [Parasegetibacter sp. NRK P23]MCM5528363.1 carboxypeptidase regulatory-like domain-containing protein [Parasegetibacter sp. NRK P23]
MKKTIIGMAAVVFAATGMYAFTNIQGGSITGKVAPADQATEVWAIQGTDTVKAAIAEGAFTLAVKPGEHTVIVDAKDPYKDVVKEGVSVTDGQATDLGEITLEQ